MARRFVNLPQVDILRRLGHGAGAIIYEGRERGSRASIAVKHVVRKGPEDDRFLEQAESEFEIAQRFDDPYLRKFYDLVRVRRWLKTRELFLLMEYAEGETLENRCKNQPPPHDLREHIVTFSRIARGLQAMHKAGYIHADIKPNNIILTRDGLKIIDFGQSCPIGHRKERVQGTPDYIAPEQVVRYALDVRTDVFNLGATMYWVATGKWFRTMLNRGQTATKKIEIDARSGNDPPQEVNPHVPLPLARLIMECCATNPDERPSDMKTLLSRLDTILLLLDRRGEPAGLPNQV